MKRKPSWAFSVTIGFLLAQAACEKNDVRDELLRSHDELFERSWDRPPNQAETAAFERKFECAWHETSRLGLHPANDFRCLARRWNALGQCINVARSLSPVVEDCRASFASACNVSSAFEQAAKACGIGQQQAKP
jgi:hypothetical protein